MGILKWLFGAEQNINQRHKRVFISFAIENIEYRNYLVEQSKKKNSPFYFIDMSAKKAWKQTDWKKRCRTKIKRCDGVIALLSKKTHLAGGARWEMKCAREEGVEIIGMHIFKNNKGAIPKELKGKRIIEWSWNNLEKFINNLEK